MIKNKQELKQYIEADSKNYSLLFASKVGLLRAIRSRICSPINDQVYVWKYIKVLRHTEYWMNQPGFTAKCMSLVYMIRLRKLSRITGFQIPIRTIGKGLTIWHWGTIIINESASVGENCVIRPGVVIGHKNDGGKCPKIGDNVEINSGVRIIGDVTIGDDVIIAPNTVVINDIPSHCIVGGIPGRVIKKRDDIYSDWIRVNNK